MDGQWLGESAVFTYDFEKFDPTDILSKLDKYKITTFCVPPTMYGFAPTETFTNTTFPQKHCCTASRSA